VWGNEGVVARGVDAGRSFVGGSAAQQLKEVIVIAACDKRERHGMITMMMARIRDKAGEA
jgi:hypothetical protein